MGAILPPFYCYLRIRHGSLGCQIALKATPKALIAPKYRRDFDVCNKISVKIKIVKITALR